jgi:hypothetical protein
MYINFKILSTKGLSPIDVVNLQTISQNKFDNLGEIITKNIPLDLIEKYQEMGYISFVKEKNKKDTLQNRVRLSTKGSEALENIQTPEITEDDLKIFEWVKNIYIKENKEIGNEKRTKMYVAQFSKESGIVQNSLAFLIKTFLSDEKEFLYSQRMQYLFFKGDTLFSTKFDLHSSRLFQYYNKNKIFFDDKFKQLEDGN